MLVRVGAHDVLGLDDAPLGDEGEHGDLGSQVLQLEQSTVLRRTGCTEHGHVGPFQHRRHRIEPGRIVVVPRHHQHRGDLREVEKGPPHDLLRRRRRRGRIEDVTGHQGEIDVVFVGEADQLGEHGAVLLGAVTTPDATPHMPVGGVQNLHSGDRRNHP